MITKSISSIEYTEENDIGSIKVVENGYEITVSKPQSWNGVKFRYPLSNDEVYNIEIDASSQNDNSLLEIILIRLYL